MSFLIRHMITWNVPTRVCVIERRASANACLDTMELRVNVLHAQATLILTLQVPPWTRKAIGPTKHSAKRVPFPAELHLVHSTINALVMERA